MRILQSLTDKPLGLIWYKHPDEVHNNDGRHIKYVNDARWHRCDPKLVSMMARVIESGNRKVAALEALPLFVNAVSYISTTCPPTTPSRGEWFTQAKRAVSDCEVIFVDPDNGIRMNSHPKQSAKHIYQHEFEALANQSDFMVAYHHFDRSCSHREQMQRLASGLQVNLIDHKIEVLRYRRVSPRAYVCAVRKSKVGKFEEAIQTITARPWDFHFERFVA